MSLTPEREGGGGMFLYGLDETTEEKRVEE
jgi:hypothetical protein